MWMRSVSARRSNVTSAYAEGMMARNRLLAWLAQGQTVVGDGALGTMLFAAGLPRGIAPELWNADEPAQVCAVHRAYVEAGAQVVETNTFGANGARLAANGVVGRVVELNLAGARLARAAVGKRAVLVAGSMGPTGEFFAQRGARSTAAATQLFAEQARGLVEGGVDLVMIETMSDLAEVKAAVDGVAAVAPEMTVAVSMTFNPDGRTAAGVTAAEAITTISGWGVRIIGANCGTGPDDMLPVLEQMAAARPAGVYLMAQSNAGLPVVVNGELHYQVTPEKMAETARRMRRIGVQIIGACCGSTPAHIAAMQTALAQAETAA